MSVTRLKPKFPRRTNVDTHAVLECDGGIFHAGDIFPPRWIGRLPCDERLWNPPTCDIIVKLFGRARPLKLNPPFMLLDAAITKRRKAFVVSIGRPPCLRL